MLFTPETPKSFANILQCQIHPHLTRLVLQLEWLVPNLAQPLPYNVHMALGILDFCHDSNRRIAALIWQAVACDLEHEAEQIASGGPLVSFKEVLERLAKPFHAAPGLVERELGGSILVEGGAGKPEV